ncbi:MAG: cupin domain-containing protein [Phycisphaerales bacterium]|nr:cupin domain-containing protein [Phycisphaerales bacterium]
MHKTDIRNAPTFGLVGDVYALLVTGEQSGGCFSLTHSIVPPGSGPPLHTHTRESETFTILEGVVTFFQGRLAPVDLGPGSVIHLEAQVPHRFANLSNRPARMLILTTPAGFERMIVEAGTPLPPGTTTPVEPTQADLARLRTACERAGIVLHV